MSVCLLIAMSMASCEDNALPYRSVHQVVAALNKEGPGCSRVTLIGNPTTAAGRGILLTQPRLRSLVKDSGSCLCRGSRVHIAVFRDPSQRDRWLKLAHALGLLNDSLIVGPTWVIGAKGGSTVDRIRKALGGQLRSA
jgi:hypothetical protein